MLQNAYFLAKIGADTAENEQHFAEILPIGRRVADRCPAAWPGSLARGVARAHAGDLTLAPSPHGACFELTLPLANAAGDPIDKFASMVEPSHAP